MRIVGGEWRGRPLAAPGGRGTRPTSDKVREAVFDVLGSLPAEAGLPGGGVTGQVVLDVFAGSGALGLEALSRRAAWCTFVEQARTALRALRENLGRFGLTAGSAGSPARAASKTAAVDLRPASDSPPGGRCRVLAGDARRVLQHDARHAPRYTLVFADPPYARYAGFEPVLARLLGPLLAPRAVLVVETAATTDVALPWSGVRVKRYGDTQVTFLSAKGEEATGGAAPHHDQAAKD